LLTGLPSPLSEPPQWNSRNSTKRPTLPPTRQTALTSRQRKKRSTQMNDHPSNTTSELTDQRIEETIAPIQERLATMNKSLKSLMDALESQQAQMKTLSARQPPEETWAERQTLLAETRREFLANPDPPPGEATYKHIGKCGLCRHLAAAYAELAPRPVDRPTSRLSLACRTEPRFQPALVVTTCNLFQQMSDAPTAPTEAPISPAQPLMN